MIPDNLVNQLQRDEGLRLNPYKCTAGKLTIGYGRNLDDVGITKDEATDLLKNDIRRVEVAVDALFPWVRDGWFPARRAVFYNMAFNIGVRGLAKFKRMLAAAEKSDWKLAAHEMLLSKWAKQVGDRATRLAKQMETGEWQ